MNLFVAWHHRIKKLITASGANVEGSGSPAADTMVDDVRALTPFDALDVSIAGKVLVVRGEVPSVTVRATADAQSRILSEVHGATLRLRMTKEMRTQRAVTITVVTDRPLPFVTLSGAGHTDLGTLSGPLSLQVSGVMDVIGQGDLGEIEIEHTGVGSLRLHGTADRVALEQSGVGTIDLGQLIAKRVKVDHSGEGAVKVHATITVALDLSGVGSVKVLGRPAQRSVHNSSVGSVSFDGPAPTKP